MSAIRLHFESQDKNNGYTKRRREEGSREVKEIIAVNFPNLGKELVIQVHEANRSFYYLNAKRLSPRHIIMKLSKANDKERILKATWEKKESNLQRNLYYTMSRFLSRNSTGWERTK